jgi:predicted 2-oxoglutarate/Fe(II)-dependent dioxygenase YbiX
MLPEQWFFWENFFTKKEIRELNAIRDEFGRIEPEHIEAHDEDGKSLKNVSKVKHVLYEHLAEKLQKLDTEVRRINRLNYGYHLDEPLGDCSACFNDYEKGDDYAWHQDGSNDVRYDLKLTVLINASLEDYEGGELQIFQAGGPRTITDFSESGNVVVFKSDIPHRCTGVTKGKRSSIAFWKSGPRFV